MSIYMELTAQDKLILDSCKTILDGLSEYLGSSYELILHSLENLDSSVIKIINGHYTGRTEGAPITDLALSMLEKIKQQGVHQSQSYFTKSPSGAILKSTTIPIIGENNRIIGLICINLHTEVSFMQLISSFLPGEALTSTQQEVFAANSNDLITSTLEEAQNSVMGNPEISCTNRNKEIINILYDKGIFNLKDSVIQVAKLLGISKNTVYMHIRNKK